MIVKLSKTCNISDLVSFAFSAIFLLIHRIFYLLVSVLFLHALQYISTCFGPLFHLQQRSVAPPKNVVVTMGMNERTPPHATCRRHGAKEQLPACHEEKTASNLCVARRPLLHLSQALKVSSLVISFHDCLSTGSTFLRGSCADSMEMHCVSCQNINVTTCNRS